MSFGQYSLRLSYQNRHKLPDEIFMNIKSPHITILDGGMGRELKAMGAPFQQPEWSALALIEAPDMVLQAHCNFISCGAEIVTTNAYALIPFHIGWDRFLAQGREWITLSAKLARQAADKSNEKIQVAGCIPPLFGSYQPTLFDRDRAADILTPLIEGQINTINFWLVETISSIEEALFVLPYLEKTDKPIWLSFCMDQSIVDDSPIILPSGEALANIPVERICKTSCVEAILLNCCPPETITDGIAILRDILPDTMRIGAYANSFERNKAPFGANEGLLSTRKELTAKSYYNYAKQWAHNGATIIGGCCGIGPDHIRHLSEGFVDTDRENA